MLFIHVEKCLFIQVFAHLVTLSRIHPPPLDSNPRKSLWVNGGDVATQNALELTLTKKSFLRSKVQLFIYILRGISLPMDLHSQEAIGRPYFLNLTELKLHSGLTHIGCHLYTSPRGGFYNMYMFPGGRQVSGQTVR